MKPVSKTILYVFAFHLSSLFLYGCGAAPSVPKEVVLTANEPPRLIQLNDAWSQVFPSESVITAGAYKFTAPSAVYVVSGAAQCWNGTSFYPCNGSSKLLRARLKIGSEICEYQADNTADTVLSLRLCSVDYTVQSTLPQGTVIELENFDAPGQLLEIQFYLSQ